MTACGFDTSGFPSADSARDLTRSELQPPDLRGERSDLRAGEAPPGPCKGKPDGALSCRFESGDGVGAAGRCQAGSFVLKRYCFVEAPCANGLCTASAPDGCAGVCPAGKICAGFENAGTIVTACVTANTRNGEGEAGTSCSSGETCRSGH